MTQAALREDTPLDAAEAARAAAALSELPRELRDGAFCGDERALADLVARCVRGEPPQRTSTVLRDVLQWRASVGADTFLSQPLPGAAAFHAAWPGAVHGADADGHCVWFERLRDVDMRALTALTDAELSVLRGQTLEALALERRAAAAAAGRAGALYTQHIYVLDVGGVSPGLLLSGAARRVMAAVSAVCSSYYGETLLRVYLVNVHAGARVAYSLLRPLLLAADTAAKVRLCGGANDFRRTAARDRLFADALPVALGGEHAGVAVATLIERALQRAADAKASAACAPQQPEAPSTPPAREERWPRMSMRRAVGACWAGAG